MQHIQDEKARYWLRVRLGLVAAVFVLGFLAIIGRVYYLQTVEAEALQERAAMEWDRQVTRQARRGDIVDRNGVELAVSVEVPSIFARPQLVGDVEAAAPRIADALELPQEWVINRLTTEQPFVWLRRQAHPRDAEAIEALGIPGLGSMTEYKRYYPMSHVAGQLLGFVGIDGEGLEGLERQFNDDLAGGTYDLSVTRDALGRPMLLSNTPRFGEFEGHSLHLTIDEKVQRVAEEALVRQIEEFDAKGGYAVALDVNTGEVLAMARAPVFNPNRVSGHQSSDWRLGPVTDTFEPGSVFKPFLLAAALQEETTTLDRVYDMQGGEMRIGRHAIRDITRRDEMTSAQIIQKSSNVGSYKLAREMGRETFYEYIRAFGFGHRTGLGLRGEQSGVVWPPDRWPEITFANVAFGQGISTTPIQLATATAALANGGRLLEPRVIDEIRNRDGEMVWRSETTMRRQVVSPQVAREVAWAMGMVTLEAGTGTAGALEHYTVAAKTGTAQQVDPETRAYSQEKWVSGFIGFAPAEAPEVAVAVFIQEPQGMRYGGRVAGPAFADIAAEALAQMGVLPLPREERFQFDDAPRPPAQDGAQRHEPFQDAVVLPTRRILSRQAQPVDGESKIPDFTHLTMRQAVEQARDAGVVPRVSGWGVVVSQVPEPGTPVNQAPVVEIVLRPHDSSEWATGGPAGALSDEGQ